VLSLSRLYSSGDWVGPVVTITIAMHAVAWACRRWGLGGVSAAAVSVVAAIVAVSWLVLPGSTRMGLPLAGTWRAAGQTLRDAQTQFHNVTAPAPATHGFILVTVLAVALLVLLADWAAFRMRATLEASVPSFTLFVFSSALGGHKNRSLTIGIELCALLAFAVIHQATVSRERSAWFANRTTGVLTSTGTVGAVIGLIAVLLSLNLAFRLPGASAKAVVKWRAADRAGGGGTREAPNPIVDLQSHLLNHTGTEVFTVKANQPAYWRLTSLDIYSSGEWMSNNSYTSVKHRLPGARSAGQSGVRVEQDFVINNLDSPWLPAAYEPDRIDGVGGISYDAQSGSLITSKNTSTGLQYHVSSVLDVGQLDPGGLAKLPAFPANDGSLGRYLQLPTIPSNVIDLAQRITAGKTTEYDKALALQNYLRSPKNFTYDETYDPHGDGPRALQYFLLQSHRGYCQQFAGSFGVMARALGLPTRLALGWTWGSQDANGVWHVTDDDTHTWPEVYFPQVGWVPFEPTPNRGMPGAQGYTGVAAQQQGSPAAAGATTPTTKPATAANPAPAPRRLPNADQGANGGASKRHHHRSWWVAPLITIGVFVLLTVVWILVVMAIDHLRGARRRVVALLASGGFADRSPGSPAGAVGLRARLVRWLRAVRSRPASEPADEAVLARAEVLLAWAEVVRLLAWWGVRRRPSETASEFARRAAGELRTPLNIDHSAEGALIKLARAATKADYASIALTAEEAEAATAQAAVVRAALTASATAWQRTRLVIDPRVGAGR
jgi:transglutaminase-like putative cysteine protease